MHDPYRPRLRALHERMAALPPREPVTDDAIFERTVVAATIAGATRLERALARLERACASR